MDKYVETPDGWIPKEDMIADLTRQLAEAREEIARLRKALEEIADTDSFFRRHELLNQHWRQAMVELFEFTVARLIADGTADCYVRYSDYQKIESELKHCQENEGWSKMMAMEGKIESLEAELLDKRQSIVLTATEADKNIDELEAKLARLVAAAELKRNAIITDAEDFKQHLQGRWVAIPEEDFDKLKAAIAATQGRE